MPGIWGDGQRGGIFGAKVDPRLQAELERRAAAKRQEMADPSLADQWHGSLANRILSAPSKLFGGLVVDPAMDMATLAGDVIHGRQPTMAADPQTGEFHTDPRLADRAMNAAGMLTLGAGAVPAEANALRTGITTRLHHGSPRTDLQSLEPSTRGPLGPGVYTSPNEGVAGRYAGSEGKTYALPERERDIFLGHGHRTDEEWAGFKRDKERLLAAAEPDKKQELSALLDRTWSGDGYPTFARISQMYGGDAKAHELFKRAGFEGLSGQVDGPEVLLFGKQGLGIRAYHGSPHDFERFDSSKIGTGEGAQAYGHGLYMAENEAVAKEYRDNLSQVPTHVLVDGDSVGEYGKFGRNPLANAAAKVLHSMGDRGGSPTAENIKDAIEQFRRLNERSGMYSADDADAIEQAMQSLEGRYVDNQTKAAGHMYQVDIAADPEHFLDWDKPLSEQSPQVQQAIEKAGISPRRESKWYAEKIGREQRPVWHNNSYYISQNGPKDFVYGKGSHYDQTGVIGFASTKEAAQKALEDAGMEMPFKTGQEALRELKYKTVGYGPDYGPEASKILREAGIPGVKYLDEGSRQAGKGTSNVVVFDDRLISILKKYGLPISAAGLAALSQLHPQEAQAAQKKQKGR